MYQVFSGNRRSAIRRSQNVTPFLSISSALQSQHTPYEAYPVQSLVYCASHKAAVTGWLYRAVNKQTNQLITLAAFGISGFTDTPCNTHSTHNFLLRNPVNSVT